MQNVRLQARGLATTIALAVSVALYVVADTGAQGPPSGQDLLGDPFTGQTSSAPVLTLNAGAPAYPCLTAIDGTGPVTGPSTIPNCNLPSPDSQGQGALRFTATEEQQASAIVYNTSLPTAQGLTITFRQYQYGGYGLGGPGSSGGADGISFFLAVAPPQPSTLGPQGGALGYASAGSEPGLPGGWLGIGLDAFGNFANPLFGSPGCTQPAWAGFTPNEITVRGPGHGTSGYCLLSSSFELGPDDNPVGALGASLRGNDRASSARTIQIVIDPLLNTYTVNIDPQGGSDFVTATSGELPSTYYDPETGDQVSGIPPRITFGFAASTGSATDIHEITSLQSKTTNGAVPILTLTKTHDLSGQATPGTSFNYVLTPGVAGTVAESSPLTIRVSDDLPSGVSPNGFANGPEWICTPTSGTAFECEYTNPTSIPPGSTLPPIAVPVTIDSGVSPGSTIVNTARVISENAASPVDASVSIVVSSGPAPLTITTTSLPTGLVGSAYSASFTGTGGVAPYSWSIQSGNLPGGVSLSMAGNLSGTPTAAGTFNFVARLTGNNGSFVTAPFSIVVTNPAIVITTSTLPQAEAGVAYPTIPLAATGGTPPLQWSVATGSLPTGLTLSAAGNISGTPTVAGMFNFTVRATDAASGTATRALSISVAPALAISTTTLPSGIRNTSYASTTIAATGGVGTRTWSLQSGALPPGLTLSAGGVISGTPTSAGNFSFTVRVVDTLGGSANRPLSISVREPLLITTSTLPGGRVGAPYSATLAATGAIGTLTWSLSSGTMPTGLSLSSAGVVAGTPTVAGTFTLNVRATDTDGAFATRAVGLAVVPALTITTTSVPNGTVGVAYPSTTLAASGGSGTRTWSIASGALPGGLLLSAAGVLSGTPTASGTFSVTVRVVDTTGGNTTRTLAISIANSSIAIATAALAPGTVSRSYVTNLQATGGVAPLRWTLDVGTLPPGMTLFQSGRLSGVPTAAGAFTFTVRVTDNVGATATRALSLRIDPALVIPPMTLARGEVDVLYRADLTATGGSLPYTWTLSSGFLPPGLILTTAGAIAGRPTASGVAAFGVTVTDADGRTASRGLAINVVPALSIVTTSLPNGVTGVAYSRQLARSGGFAPFAWSLSSGALPAGLTLSAAGLISGSPTTGGTFTISVRVADALGGSATAPLAITIRNARPQKAYLISNDNIAACVRFRISCNSAIVAVDLEGRRVTNTIRLENTNLRVPARASSDGRFVYQVASPFGLAPSRLLKIDTSNDTVVIDRPLTVHPNVLALSADDSTIYVGYQAGLGGGGIQRLNPRSLAVVATYPNPAFEIYVAIAVSPDNSSLYATIWPQSQQPGRIDTVNAADGRVVRSASLGTYVRPFGAELTPNGTRLLVSYSRTSPEFTYEWGFFDFDVSSNTFSRIPLDTSGYVQIRGFFIRDDQRLYATMADSRAGMFLTELSLVTNRVVATSPLGWQVTDRLVPDSLGNAVFLGGTSSWVLSGIDLDTKATTPILDLGAPPNFSPRLSVVAKGG